MLERLKETKDIRTVAQRRAAFEEFLAQPQVRNAYFRASLMSQSRKQRRLALLMAICSASGLCRAGATSLSQGRVGWLEVAFCYGSFLLGCLCGYSALTCLSRGKVLRFESVSLSIGTMAEAGTENVRDLYRRVEQKMLVDNEV